jgi:hypothetical protein
MRYFYTKNVTKLVGWIRETEKTYSGPGFRGIRETESRVRNTENT